VVLVLGPERLTTSGEVLGVAALAHRAAQHRRAGHRVVLTNGCFDVLHGGHVSCLQAARDLGDVLVVAVNSDAGVTRLKGPGRPINSVADRAAVLAALRCVDYVTVFDDDTPLRVIEKIRPHLFVKGGDYRTEALPEAPTVERYGGQVVILGYMPGRSTTGMVERIRAAPEHGTRPQDRKEAG
jgi:D-beta-D-heptose 7-phosphate kinase / D-beta-D-heptose 1-phosphate adenosyltransferase